MTQQTEGKVDQNLTDWLQSWDLQEYEQKLREQKIKKPKDFIFVKSKEHFDGLMASLGPNVPYMDKLKFEDAWKTIVPQLQTQPAQLLFLEKQDHEIMTQLYQRFDDLSQDITTIKNAYNNFTQSVVISKKSINDNANTLIVTITSQKEQLLKKINDLQRTGKNKFEAKLNVLEKMNKLCLQSKDSFNQIARLTKVTSSQKTHRLNQLLSMNINNINADNDDEKQEEMKENYDHYLYIGNECIIPGKVATVFDRKQFTKALQSCFTVRCDDITSKWNVKQYYNGDKFVKFSDKFRSKGNVFRVENEKGTIHHIDANGFHYILTDTVPVYEGIHTWRVKMQNQRDVFWGICQAKPCTDRAFEDKTAFAIGQYGNYVAVAGNWSSNSPNTGIAPFKKKNVVIDMKLNCEKHTLEFNLVGQNEKHVFIMNNIPAVVNPEKGWVLCFCMRYNNHSIQVTKIGISNGE